MTIKISGDESFERLKNEFPENTKLLMEKGVYFYDYAGNYEVFSQIEFPPYSAFYSQLKDENITTKEYERGCNVYKTFKCTTLLDYMLLYVKLDTGQCFILFYFIVLICYNILIQIVRSYR